MKPLQTLAKIFKPPVQKAGGFAGGWNMPLGGWLPAAANMWNFWQCGFDVLPFGRSPVVEACISAYAQTIAMCPGAHWRVNPDGGRVRVTNSALSRILRKPNSYETPPEFMNNAIDSLYSDGNAYALALRNDRFEIDSLHLMVPQSCFPRVADNGEVFYTLAGNPVIDRMFAGRTELLGAVPARDVLHVKLRSRAQGAMFQLKGESPILSAAMDDAASNAMARQALTFYMNASRPSGVLETALPLKEDQIDILRRKWEEHSTGVNQGGVAILSNGLQWKPLAPTARDSQLAEILGYTDKRIASVFRIPLPILNLGEGQIQGATEALMQFWISTGLGFALNHVEEAFGKLFQLFGQPTEYCEFSTDALLRSLFKDQIEGLVRGVTGGVLAPNEARAKLEYGAVEEGDSPRVQQQMVPLEAWDQAQPAAPPAPPAPPPAANDDGASTDGAAAKQLTELVAAAINRYEHIRA